MRRDIFSLLIFPIFLAGLCLLFLCRDTSASTATAISPSTNSPHSSETETIGEKLANRSNIFYHSIHFKSRDDRNNRRVIWSGDLQAILVDNLGITHQLWSSSQQLSSLSDVVTQRSYRDNANTGRHVLTFLDLDGDGAVTPAEIRPFAASTFTKGTYGILDVPDEASAQTLVNYIRGDESQNSTRHLRNRTLDIDGDDNAEVLRLGDIIHSSAIEVGAPSEAYDLLYGDTSYGQFRNRYSTRRRMVYVGANDGMIHAFNAGFYDSKSHSYELISAPTNVPHPMGSELWAYVPYNLLPRIKQLQAPDYAHAWYMDGSPRAFDARIFPDDKTHPGGWGTLLVMGMRLGGSQIILDTKDKPDAFGAWKAKNAAASTIQCQSAYVLMDITDPESEPTVIAEITDPRGNMGYTTSQPAIVPFQYQPKKSPTGINEWYLVFGSGPAFDLPQKVLTATTGASAKFYAYDLTHRGFVGNNDDSYLYDLGKDSRIGAPASFVGDPVVVDWDLDGQADALYFGTVGGDASMPDGKLFKISLKPTAGSSSVDHWTAPVALMDIGNPVAAAPAVARDEYNNHWIIAGTGRLYTDDDAKSTKTQSLFGIIDRLSTPKVSYSDLVETGDTTNAGSDTGKGNPQSVTEDALEKLIRERGGWKHSLKRNPDEAAERSVGKVALFDDTLFATTFTPHDSSNPDEGHSHLYCLNYKTGTPASGNGDCKKSSGAGLGNELTYSTIDLGFGMAASPTLFLDNAMSSGLSVITSTSIGNVTRSSTSITQNARSGEIDWREIRR